MNNKDLMTLVEEYGAAMKEFGYQNGTSFLDSPSRIKAMLESDELTAKIERELGMVGDA